MRKTTAALITMFMLALAAPGFSNWEISFGKEEAQVGVTAPVGAEDVPAGPGSFRGLGADLWVLDSVKGRVLCFQPDNKMTKEVKIPGLEKEFLLADFALQLSEAGEPVAVVVLDGRAKEIIKIGSDGKELLRIRADKLIQLDEAEVDRNGQIYVGDYASNFIAVFAADGKHLRNIPWQMSGFAVDKDNNLHMIDFKDGLGHALVTLAADGKELSRRELGMADMQNPRIWSVNEKGEALVSFVPPLGNPANQNLFTYSEAGEILNKASFSNPYYVNRYLAVGKEAAWLVKADYLQAPAMAIKVESVSLAK